MRGVVVSTASKQVNKFVSGRRRRGEEEEGGGRRRRRAKIPIEGERYNFLIKVLSTTTVSSKLN
jgi:hypothetical protein